MEQALFHQARPLELWDIFLAKNLLHVTLVRVIKSLLACVSDAMSVMRGRGKRANASFHSCSIWSSIIQLVCIGGGGGGIMRGRSSDSVAWSEEIDFLKDMEHVVGKKGFSRKAMLTKM